MKLEYTREELEAALAHLRNVHTQVVANRDHCFNELQRYVQQLVFCEGEIAAIERTLNTEQEATP